MVTPVKVGWLDQFLRGVGIGVGLIATVPLLALILISTGNVYFAVLGAIAIPVALLGVSAVRIHTRTGRWWFLPLPKHLFLPEPTHETPTVYFWRAVEFSQ